MRTFTELKDQRFAFAVASSLLIFTASPVHSDITMGMRTGAFSGTTPIGKSGWVPFTYTASGSDGRIDIASTANIVNLSKHKSAEVSDTNKQFTKADLDDAETVWKNEQTRTTVKLAADKPTFLGHRCRHYVVTITYPAGDIRRSDMLTADIHSPDVSWVALSFGPWVSKQLKGVVLRCTTSKALVPGQTEVVEATSVSTGPVSKAKFQIPADYKEVKIGSSK